MFSLFMHHFAAVAEPMIPAEEPDRAGGQNQTTASAVALCEISP